MLSSFAPSFSSIPNISGTGKNHGESIKTRALVCTCGHHYGEISTETKQQSPQNRIQDSGNSKSLSQDSKAGVESSPMDASFVQISSSLLIQQQQQDKALNRGNDKNSQGPEQQCNSITNESKGVNGRTSDEKARLYNSSMGFMGSYRYLKVLEHVIENPSTPPALCLKCVERIELALESDATRLQKECYTYENAIQEDQASRKAWKQTISLVATSGFSNSSSMMNSTKEGGEGLAVDKSSRKTENKNAIIDDSFERAEDAFRREIDALEEACRNQEAELSHLRSLENEQLLLHRDLDEAHDTIAEEHNALELEARAFENEQEQLMRSLYQIQDELARVSSPSIRLPETLFHLQVDKRGLRYPLINELRLAYRPKGDVQWEEIQGAWSLAAQLLLVTGTLFEFQSKHCKLIPLSQCAKLIYYPPDNSSTCGKIDDSQKRRDFVYNLGHPTTNAKRALLTLNALMCQIIHFVNKKMGEACDSGVIEDASIIPSLPFTSTSTKIGDIILTQLSENDDAGWSRAIHYMASNLLWLSEITSLYVLNQVLLM